MFIVRDSLSLRYPDLRGYDEIACFDLGDIPHLYAAIVQYMKQEGGRAVQQNNAECLRLRDINSVGPTCGCLDGVCSIGVG